MHVVFKEDEFGNETAENMSSKDIDVLIDRELNRLTKDKYWEGGINRNEFRTFLRKYIRKRIEEVISERKILKAQIDKNVVVNEVNTFESMWNSIKLKIARFLSRFHLKEKLASICLLV